MTSKRSTSLDIRELREHFAALGQDQIFRFWEQLDEAQQASLSAQASRIAPELPELIAAHARATTGQGAGTTARPSLIEPVEAISLPSGPADERERDRARRSGEALIAAGRMAAFVVAGGQGTRLGFAGPKGAFPVGPISERSLFEIQAQKLRGLSRRAGRSVPWYVMTSSATDAATRELFEAADYFGLSRNDVFIFPQSMVPAFDFEGRIMLESTSQIAESPNGHGGALTALADSGALDDMEQREIDTIFYYQVDNPLVKIGDPVYLGFHDNSNAEMSCKVVRKIDPHEKVGVLARIDGGVGIIEYTELADEQRFARSADNELVYWAGNIAVHLLAAPFVRRVAARAEELLPYHVSAKKIPGLGAAGLPIAPAEPTGYKMERFVFDALTSAREVCIVEAAAEEEFSPIKNAQGKDSPDSSRRDLTALYRRWLASAEIEVPESCEQIEIDHSVIDSPEDLRDAGFESLADAGDAIRIQSERT